MRDYWRFHSLSQKHPKRFRMKWSERLPCLFDKGEHIFDRHYVIHTAWAARALVKVNPKQHRDISSSLYFSALVSAFVPTTFYDYRPVKLQMSNFTSNFANLLMLPFKDESIESISCMHVVEHIGLGRYGDSIDPNGDLKAIAELQRVVARGGSLLFVVPMGRPRIVYNAHRIYSYDQIRHLFKDFALREFALIPDNPLDGDLIINAKRELCNRQEYGCGCFWFQKKSVSPIKKP